MGGLGGQNPFPFQLGGGTSDSEQVWAALRSAVGRRAGDAPIEPEGGIADAWRWAKAKAIAAALSSSERAALQIFPAIAEDRLDMYEAILLLPGADTLAERQEAAANAWTSTFELDIPHVTAALQRIDPALSIDVVDPVRSVTTNFGQVFESHNGATFGTGVAAGVKSAKLPNYATDFILLVRYTLAAGQPRIPTETRAAVAKYLNAALPSWVDWTLYTATGFLLDGGPDGTSLLDETAFG
jgi:hypothetical protein